MTTSSSQPVALRSFGPATATASAGVALAVAIAAGMLASAMAGGAAVETPPPSGMPEVEISAPVHPVSPTITTNGETERRGGSAYPLHAD